MSKVRYAVFLIFSLLAGNVQAYAIDGDDVEAPLLGDAGSRGTYSTSSGGGGAGQVISAETVTEGGVVSSRAGISFDSELLTPLDPSLAQAGLDSIAHHLYWLRLEAAETEARGVNNHKKIERVLTARRDFIGRFPSVYISDTQFKEYLFTLANAAAQPNAPLSVLLNQSARRTRELQQILRGHLDERNRPLTGQAIGETTPQDHGGSSDERTGCCSWLCF